MTTETFSSRWSLLLAALGMAVGTGNIWRFPRVAAQNGGAPFLVPWFIFLFLWSIPLLVIEFGLGKKTRMGTVGAFGSVDRRITWMGGFLGCCTLAITFYYSVVTGWCFRYALASLVDMVVPGGAPGGGLWQAATTGYWLRFTESGWQPVVAHVAAVSLCAWIIHKGVVGGIERANRILLPALFALLVVAAVRAVTLPGAAAGLEFLFRPRWGALLDVRIWLEGMTQSAWSTGAGWGLILTYAVYVRRNEDIVANSVLAGLGNNSASLLAAIAVIPTVFAILPAVQAADPSAVARPAAEVLADPGPLSTGLTFIWIPRLFERIAGGRIFLFVFFLSLSIAAVSSLIAMIELGTRIVMDFGLTRRRGILIVAAACVLFGIPSALSPGFFQNQDWVWSVGLLVNGLFLSIAVMRYGAGRFRRELVDCADNDFRLGRFFTAAATVILPLEFGALIVWWSTRAILHYDPERWWHPFRTFSLGTCIFQWGVLIALLLLFDRRIRRRLFGDAVPGGDAR